MNILCYGDSNTWGMIPMDGSRFDFYDRWPNILGSLLSDEEKDVNIIEEGLNGRTADEVDYDEPFLNGRSYMPACMLSHRPVDILIVMLGTNDVKNKYRKPVDRIAHSICRLVRDMKEVLDNSQTERVKVLLVSPKKIDERVLGDSAFDEESLKKSEKLGKLLETEAAEKNWYFLNADNDEITVGEDGLHLSADGHRNLAKQIFEIVKGF